MMLKKFISILVSIFICNTIAAIDSIDTIAPIDTVAAIDSIDSIPAIDSIEIIHLPFDSVLHDYFLEKAFTIDCERTDSGAVYYSDSVYIARLQSMPHVLSIVIVPNRSITL